MNGHSALLLAVRRQRSHALFRALDGVSAGVHGALGALSDVLWPKF